MAMEDRDSRFKWQKDKEQELWSYIERKTGEGISVTAALKEYGEVNGMSWLTARWKYYQLRKRRVDKPQTTSVHVPPTEEDFISHLAEFVSLSQEAGEDIVPLIKGLSRLARLSCQGLEIRKHAILETQEAKRSLNQMNEAFLELRQFLRQWLSLPQVEQVGSLKDFTVGLNQQLENMKTS